MVRKTVLNREEFEVLQFRFFAIDWADRPNWLGIQGLRDAAASAREVKNAFVVQNSFVLHHAVMSFTGKSRHLPFDRVAKRARYCGELRGTCVVIGRKLTRLSLLRYRSGADLANRSRGNSPFWLRADG